MVQFLHLPNNVQGNVMAAYEIVSLRVGVRIPSFDLFARMTERLRKKVANLLIPKGGVGSSPTSCFPVEYFFLRVMCKHYFLRKK